MKYLSYIFIVLLLFPTVLMAEEISLDEAMKVAIKNNYSIAATKLKTEQTKSRMKSEAAQPNPEMNLAVGIRAEDCNNINQKFRIQPFLKQTRAEYEYQKELALYEEEVLGLVYDVKTAYFQVLAAEENVKLSQENLDLIASIYKAVQKRFDMGEVPKLQTVKAKLEVTRAENELLSMQTELSLSTGNFKRLLGREIKSDLTVKKISWPAIQLNDIEELKNITYKSRPLLQSAEYEMKSAESQLTVSSWFFLPEAKLAYYQNALFDSDNRGVSFSLSFPIFDWGQAGGEIEGAQFAILEAKQCYLDSKNKVDMELESGFLKVNETQKKLKSFEEGILEESQTLLEMTRKGYEKGATGFLEVLEAQRTLKETKAEYQQIYIDYQTAVAQLERAIGENIFTEGVKK